MRIGIDYRPVTAAPQTGIARQARALFESVAAIPGCEAVPLTALPPMHPDPGICVCPGWNSQHLHRPLQRLRFEQTFLPQAFRSEGLSAHIATANSGLPWFSRPNRIRYIVLLHDIFQLTLARRGLRDLPYRLFDAVNLRCTLRRADYIWAPSVFTAKEAETLLPHLGGRVRVLPNRVDRVIPDTPGPSGLPSRYWLVVGLREPRKNVRLFLEAWARASTLNSSVPSLVLVGERGEVPSDHLGRQGIHILNHLTDGALAAIYRKAEALWHPSYAEGFGLPPLEALSQGTPVIVAYGSALDETVPADAPRFHPHDRDGLVTLMLHFATAPPVRDLARLVHWVDRFNANAHRQQVQKLLSEALDH
ncbi:MAG: glycosyltransferase family 4 protein [Acidiferrobacteraceae bacterium]